VRAPALKSAGTLVVAAALASSAGAAGPAAAAWALRMPAEPAVLYRGSVNMDGAGQPAGQMMYPAPSAAGLLAAIITHGVMVESSKNSQKRRLQEEADKVLAPYRPALAGFTHGQLMQTALGLTTSTANKRLLGTDENAGGDLVIVSTPVYTLTQDHRALVLDNTIAIQRSDHGSRPSYEQVIRVVSAPRAEAEPAGYWAGDEAQALKQESARLLAHSLDLALRDVDAAPSAGAAAFRTVKYQEGASQKMERALTVDQPCERLILRTLRGGLLSVPASGNSPAGCVPALPDWK
jgi:hypothetical protein